MIFIFGRKLWCGYPKEIYFCLFEESIFALFASYICVEYNIETVCCNALRALRTVSHCRTLNEFFSWKIVNPFTSNQWFRKIWFSNTYYHFVKNEYIYNRIWWKLRSNIIFFCFKWVISEIISCQAMYLLKRILCMRI